MIVRYTQNELPFSNEEHIDFSIAPMLQIEESGVLRLLAFCPFF